MQIMKITASEAVKCNTGNYESVDHFISMKAELHELDDPIEMQALLDRKVQVAMLIRLERFYKARGKSLSKREICVQHGLPLDII